MKVRVTFMEEAFLVSGSSLFQSFAAWPVNDFS